MNLPSGAESDVRLALYLADQLWADAVAHQQDDLCDLEWDIRLWAHSTTATTYGVADFLRPLFAHPSQVRFQ